MTPESKRVAMRQMRLLALGLCRQCGKRPNTVGTRCPECSDKNKKHLREYRRCLAVMGVCSCGDGAVEGKRRCVNCAANASAKQSLRNYKLKLDVFAHYGDKCSCCGESEPDFLNMDHIAGGGARHRKEDPATNFIYRWLEKRGYPTGFRILCCNCNMSARLHEGVCIHQLIRDALRPTDDYFEMTTTGDQSNG